MEDKVTIDSILGYLKNAIEEKIPLPPTSWLDAAVKLNVLMEDLDDEWVSAKMAVAEQRAFLIKEGNSVSAAKSEVEGTPEFREFLRLEAKRERITEYIRLCKKRTEVKDW